MLAFERKYGIRSETFYAAYASGEEPEDDNWVLDFGEWASIYRTWLARQAQYRDEIQRIQRNTPKRKNKYSQSEKGLVALLPLSLQMIKELLSG